MLQKFRTKEKQNIFKKITEITNQYQMLNDLPLIFNEDKRNVNSNPYFRNKKYH